MQEDLDDDGGEPLEYRYAYGDASASVDQVPLTLSEERARQKVL